MTLTYHLNWRYLTCDEIQLLFFSFSPCWKVWDHHKFYQWQILTLIVFKIIVFIHTNCIIVLLGAIIYIYCKVILRIKYDGWVKSFKNSPYNHRSHICHLAALPGSLTDHTVGLLNIFLLSSTLYDTVDLYLLDRCNLL